MEENAVLREDVLRRLAEEAELFALEKLFELFLHCFSV